MKTVVESLKNLNFTISSCESITGGLFSKKITDISGASAVFKGSIVAYSNEVKTKIVQIKSDIIKKNGAISYECALAMAENTKKLFQTDVAISFTGNAGPNIIEHKAVGLIYVALIIDNNCIVEKLNLHGSRKVIRKKVIKHAVKLLILHLNKLKKESPK